MSVFSVIKRMAASLTAAVTAATLACCANSDDDVLSPQQPVTVTVWSYYNGVQLTSFEKLIKEFNDTKGSELGIYVESVSMGSVDGLTKELADADKESLPDIVSAYPDQAYSFAGEGMLVDFREYLTQNEIESFVDAYIEEGVMGENGEIFILPVAKSTEVMMLNLTKWNEFAEATGADIAALETVEGVIETAERYYLWTDSLTPDVAEDGKAFFGRDAAVNMFLCAAHQLDSVIFEKDGQKATLNADKELFRRIWDSYYVPYINGYFTKNAKFSSDDLKVEDIVCYVGATSSAAYFPESVVADGVEYAIEGEALMLPVYEGGTKAAVSQGAGMCIFKSDETTESAGVSFLKWFTEKERNLEFSYSASYLPVKDEANNYAFFKDAVIGSGTEISAMSDKVFKAAFEQTAEYELCYAAAFDGCTEAREILTGSLNDKCEADRQRVVNLIESGTSREDAVALFDTEENFEEWFELLCQSLENVLQQP